MATVKGKGKPQGFRLMPEGQQNLHIVKVEGLPRANVELVKVKFVNEDGITLDNKYDLTSDGGYAAFYYLVLNGLGVDLDEGDEFNIDDLDDKYVLVEIVHKEGTKPREDGSVAVFANIKATIGPGTPFGDDESGEWD
jgi:hypothetical protein